MTQRLKLYYKVLGIFSNSLVSYAESFDVDKDNFGDFIKFTAIKEVNKKKKFNGRDVTVMIKRDLIIGWSIGDING